MYSSCRGVPGGAKSATACITLLRIADENNIGGFDQDCQTAKFNSPSNFSGISYVHSILLTTDVCVEAAFCMYLRQNPSW